MSWIEPVGRAGFAARGIVYVLVGLLTARAAAGLGGRTTDAQGALHALGAGPMGPLVLTAVALGLACYSCWRFAQAFLDLDHEGLGVRGLAVRGSFVTSGLVHVGLALTAVDLAVGIHRGRRDLVRSWTARALDEPFGAWLVGTAGLVVIVVGAYQFYKAWARSFEDGLRTARMSAAQRRWAGRIGRMGLAARGTTLGIIGWFLLRAALDADAREARGVAGALRALGRQDHGRWLLFIVAVGLAAYGLQSIVFARFRRITN